MIQSKVRDYELNLCGGAKKIPLRRVANHVIIRQSMKGQTKEYILNVLSNSKPFQHHEYDFIFNPSTTITPSFFSKTVYYTGNPKWSGDPIHHVPFNIHTSDPKHVFSNPQYISRGGFGNIVQYSDEHGHQIILKMENTKEPIESDIADITIEDTCRTARLRFIGTRGLFIKRHLYVMQKFDGNCHDFIPGQPRATKQQYNFWLQVSEEVRKQVMWLFHRGFYYTDLKPENVLYSKHPNGVSIHLGDLGAAVPAPTTMMSGRTFKEKILYTGNIFIPNFHRQGIPNDRETGKPDLKYVKDALPYLIGMFAIQIALDFDQDLFPDLDSYTYESDETKHEHIYNTRLDEFMKATDFTTTQQQTLQTLLAWQPQERHRVDLNKPFEFGLPKGIYTEPPKKGIYTEPSRSNMNDMTQFHPKKINGIMGFYILQKTTTTESGPNVIMLMGEQHGQQSCSRDNYIELYKDLFQYNDQNTRFPLDFMLETDNYKYFINEKDSKTKQSYLTRLRAEFEECYRHEKGRNYKHPKCPYKYTRVHWTEPAQYIPDWLAIYKKQRSGESFAVRFPDDWTSRFPTLAQKIQNQNDLVQILLQNPIIKRQGERSKIDGYIDWRDFVGQQFRYLYETVFHDVYEVFTKWTDPKDYWWRYGIPLTFRFVVDIYSILRMFRDPSKQLSKWSKQNRFQNIIYHTGEQHTKAMKNMLQQMTSYQYKIIYESTKCPDPVCCEVDIRPFMNAISNGNNRYDTPVSIYGGGNWKKLLALLSSGAITATQTPVAMDPHDSNMVPVLGFDRDQITPVTINNELHTVRYLGNGAQNTVYEIDGTDEVLKVPIQDPWYLKMVRPTGVPTNEKAIDYAIANNFTVREHKTDVRGLIYHKLLKSATPIQNAVIAPKIKSEALRNNYVHTFDNDILQLHVKLLNKGLIHIDGNPKNFGYTNTGEPIFLDSAGIDFIVNNPDLKQNGLETRAAIIDKYKEYIVQNPDLQVLFNTVFGTAIHQTTDQSIKSNIFRNVLKITGLWFKEFDKEMFNNVIVAALRMVDANDELKK